MPLKADSIPQITYDIIARILPGFVFLSLILLSATTIETKTIKINDKISEVTGLYLFGVVDLEIGFFDTVLFIIGCYFLGWLFYRNKSQISEAAREKKFEKIAPNFQEKINHHLFGTSFGGQTSKEANLLRWMYHYVRLNNPVAGLRLVKLRAEARMWECINYMWRWWNLPLLFILLSLLPIFVSWISMGFGNISKDNWIWLGVKMLLLILFFLGGRQFYNNTSLKDLWSKYWENIVSHYQLLSPISFTSNYPKFIVFTNCAGAAKKEMPKPMGLGGYIAGTINMQGEIVAVGISEVIKSEREGINSNNDSAYIDDLKGVEKGLGIKVVKSDYFPHLDSQIHNGEKAKRKWIEEDSSPRIREEKKKNRRVTQGTGILLFSNSNSIDHLMLKPAGEQASSTDENPAGNPTDYKGNRDTEPRAAVIVREFQLFKNLKVDLAFCQLETRNGEERNFSYHGINEENASNRRKQQLERLCKKLLSNNENRPIILMGDFNARPGSKELNYLFDKFKLQHVLPTTIVKEEDRGDWGKKYVFGAPAIIPPTLSKPESEQGWTYSHLKHKILIDHAFVRGFDVKEWNLKLQILPFPDETKEVRYSDHRPVVLSIEKR